MIVALHLRTGVIARGRPAGVRKYLTGGCRDEPWQRFGKLIRSEFNQRERVALFDIADSKTCVQP